MKQLSIGVAFGSLTLLSIALALSAKGDLSGDPDVMIAGLPSRTRAGAGMDEVVDSAIFEPFENLPRGKRRDADAVSTAIERAVRNAVNAAWGKKPTVHGSPRARPRPSPRRGIRTTVSPLVDQFSRISSSSLALVSIRTS